jgi:hypothetical protein
LPLGSKIFAFVCSRGVPEYSVAGSERDAEMPHAALCAGEHLLGRGMERQLHPEEPDVDEVVRRPADVATEDVGIEGGRLFEVAHCNGHVEDGIHASDATKSRAQPTAESTRLKVGTCCAAPPEVGRRPEDRVDVGLRRKE